MRLAIGLAIGTGLSLIAGLLTPRNRQGSRSGLGEDTPPRISTKGVYLPMIRGTRKSSEIIAGWSKITQINEDDGGGAKNLGGGLSGGGGTTYRAQVWHLAGLGPAGGLRQIRFDNKVVWEGDVTPENSPSGTEISTGKVGSFKVYWGEPDQPIDPLLRKENKVGIASRWPGVCHFVWDTMRYGSSPVEPQVEYVIDWLCAGSSLSLSDYEITGDGSAKGVNPAHLLQEILVSKPFTGCGYGLSEIDNSSLEQVGVNAQNDGIPVNVEYREGQTAEAAVQAILVDLGIQMPEKDKRIAFVPLRYDPVALYPSLNDDTLEAADTDIEITLHENDVPSESVYFIKNEDGYNYRDQDIDTGGGAAASTGTGLINSNRVEITTVTNVTVASQVSRRRKQEDSIDKSIRIRVMRGMRNVYQGMSILHPNYGQLMVFGVKWSDEKPTTELVCSIDTYRVADTTDIVVVPDPSEPLDAEADVSFAIFQRPSDFQISQFPELFLFRIRAHSEIAGADARVSTQANSDYVFSGQGQTHGQGGLLEETIADDASSPIDFGPRFEPANDDMVEALDLSSDSVSHQAGRQLCLINGEMFYVQSFDAQNEVTWTASTEVATGEYRRPSGASPGLRFKASGGGTLTTGEDEPEWPDSVGSTVLDGNVTWTAHRYSYVPRNMIRARMGTTAANHAIGDTVFISDILKLKQIVHPAWSTGVTAYVKAVPYTEGGQVDISTISPESLVIA